MPAPWKKSELLLALHELAVGAEEPSDVADMEEGEHVRDAIGADGEEQRRGRHFKADEGAEARRGKGREVLIFENHARISDRSLGPAHPSRHHSLFRSSFIMHIKTQALIFIVVLHLAVAHSQYINPPHGSYLSSCRQCAVEKGFMSCRCWSVSANTYTYAGFWMAGPQNRDCADIISRRDTDGQLECVKRTTTAHPVGVEVDEFSKTTLGSPTALWVPPAPTSTTPSPMSSTKFDGDMLREKVATSYQTNKPRFEEAYALMRPLLVQAADQGKLRLAIFTPNHASVEIPAEAVPCGGLCANFIDKPTEFWMDLATFVEKEKNIKVHVFQPEGQKNVREKLVVLYFQWGRTAADNAERVCDCGSDAEMDEDEDEKESTEEALKWRSAESTGRSGDE